MQTTLTAGDSIDWLDADALYPASSGWILKTRLTPRVAGTAAVFTATAEGDSFRTKQTSAQTAALVPGGYSVTQWVEKGDDRATLINSQITVLPNPASLTVGTDTRSHLEKVISNIEAVLENKASNDVQEFVIGDKSLKKMTVAELIGWRDRYKAELAREQNSSKTGKQFGRKIYTRM
jgi:hypothetical protein